MPQFLVHFAQAHNDFRLPELQSIAELHGISYTLPEDEKDRDPYRPWMVIGLPSEDDARTLARRCILIKYAVDTSVFQNLRLNKTSTGRYMSSTRKGQRMRNYTQTTAKWSRSGVVMSQTRPLDFLSLLLNIKYLNQGKGMSLRALPIWDSLERLT